MDHQTQLQNAKALFSQGERQKKLAARLKSSQRSLGMPFEEAMAQISRNGSVKSPNPFYRG